MAHQDAVTTHEQELTEYLQERIKPGLNRGAIPLLARSIAKEIVRREHLNGGSEDNEADGEYDEKPDDEPALEAGDADDVEAEADDEPEGEPDDEADDEPTDEADDGPDDEVDDEPDDESESPLDEFEAEMHELQAELGEDWIVRFSVQGDEAWLTAEKQDGSQHVEGPTAEVLLAAVELLDEGGGRPG
jgi:hypothetical protein